MENVTMCEVVDELVRREFDATFEYPGFMRIAVIDGTCLECGDSGDTIICDVTDGEGLVFDSVISSIPRNTTDVRGVADFIACTATSLLENHNAR